MSKLTGILADTWRGMVQRRLWPVAVLLLAGLVAVPLLLTAKPEPVAPPPATAAGDAAELAAQPLVTVASAAERESARRVLGARKDPFKPTNRSKAGKQARKPGDGSSKTGTASSDGDSKPATGVGQAPASGGSGYVAPAPLPTAVPPDTGEKRPQRPAGSLSVRWGTAGDEQLEALRVQRLDPLPTADEPLLVYLGLTEDGRKAVFMLDAGVTVEGDGRCRPSPDDCQTVELAPGETQFIEVVDETETTTQYQLDLVKIHGRRAARASRKDTAADARAASRTLKSLGHPAPAYRFDARTGRLERIAPRE